MIGNGVCNIETNNAICNFDGLDCCESYLLVGNGICDDETNTDECFNDGGDCCLFPKNTGIPLSILAIISFLKHCK